MYIRILNLGAYFTNFTNFTSTERPESQNYLLLLNN